MIKPSGWHTVRYDDLITTKYLYNRCHLIAFQLAGENANEKNLITGTRHMNEEMIQGGCPKGNGTGGPGYSIKGEFTANGVLNELKHTRGVLSMARSMMPDSAGSQFFVMVDDAPHLDGQYAAFGKVTEGMEAADKIVSVQRDWNDCPREKQVIKTITIVEE